tara:strand:- start:511 stop:690 length:180 start_codon:yes stop_codon:yes gene_type:complete
MFIVKKAYDPKGKNVSDNTYNFFRRTSNKFNAKGTYGINNGYLAVGRDIKTGKFASLKS